MGRSYGDSSLADNIISLKNYKKLLNFDKSEGIIELKNKEKEIGKSYFKAKSEKSIDISITPNRADCLGIRGIARDLSSAGVGKLIQVKRKKIKQTAKRVIKT